MSSDSRITRSLLGHDLSRRHLVVGGLSLAVAATGAGGVLASGLPPTPRQTAGPFYPREWRGEADADLVQVAGRPRRAAGQVAHITGRILRPDGRPFAGLQVEIWQCDALGRYHHPGEPREGADLNFQGYGRVTVGADGAYHFRTLKPVPYPGRTPHIHFRVSGPGMAPMTTQMYLAGEPRNATDFLFARLSEAERRRLLVDLRPAPSLEPEALTGEFDIIIG